jgi:hypothetical protein
MGNLEEIPRRVMQLKNEAQSRESTPDSETYTKMNQNILFESRQQLQNLNQGGISGSRIKNPSLFRPNSSNRKVTMEARS